MDILVLVAGVIVVALAVGYVFYPLFRPPGRGLASLPEADAQLTDLLSERDVVLQALRDLDFDYRMGRLSDQDYQALRARYAARGVAILQHLDAAAGLASEQEALEEGIEAEIRRLRERPAREPVKEAVRAPAAVSLEEAIEEEVRRLRARPAPAGAKPTRKAARAEARQKAGRCPNCGQPYLPGVKFCARCGRTLVRVCPSCGATAGPEARFCAQCGAKL